MSGAKAKKNDSDNTPTTDERTTLAETAFAAYRGNRGERSFTGGSIPDWEGAAPEIQEAWRVAIDAVLAKVDEIYNV